VIVPLHQILLRLSIKGRSKLAGYIALVGEMIVAYNILVGKPEGERPLVRPRRRWKDNNEINLREV
jgi:hypothetical protein